MWSWCRPGRIRPGRSGYDLVPAPRSNLAKWLQGMPYEAAYTVICRALTWDDSPWGYWQVKLERLCTRVSRFNCYPLSVPSAARAAGGCESSHLSANDNLAFAFCQQKTASWDQGPKTGCYWPDRELLAESGSDAAAFPGCHVRLNGGRPETTTKDRGTAIARAGRRRSVQGDPSRPSTPPRQFIDAREASRGWRVAARPDARWRESDSVTRPELFA
jgi:hypothetical protein